MELIQRSLWIWIPLQMAVSSNSKGIVGDFEHSPFLCQIVSNVPVLSYPILGVFSIRGTFCSFLILIKPIVHCAFESSTLLSTPNLTTLFSIQCMLNMFHKTPHRRKAC